jgi:hypothetical protein
MAPEAQNAANGAIGAPQWSSGMETIVQFHVQKLESLSEPNSYGMCVERRQEDTGAC